MDAINLSDAREVNAKVREREKEICMCECGVSG